MKRPIGNNRQWPSDELYHWKYIKREKKNGKWKYYYKDTDLEKAEKDFKEAEANLNTWKDRKAISEANRDSHIKMITSTTGPISPAQKELIGDRAILANRQAIRYAEAGKKYATAKKNLEKARTKHVTDFAPTLIRSGVNTVKKFLKKLFK